MSDRDPSDGPIIRFDLDSVPRTIWDLRRELAECLRDRAARRRVAVCGQRSRLSALSLARIEHLRFTSFDGRTLHLAVDEEGAELSRFLAGQSDRIADLVRRATGRNVRVHIEAAAGTPRSAAPAAEEAAVEARSLPDVAEAMDLFDAEIVDVQDDEGP